MPTPRPEEIVIVTTAAKLVALIDDAVDHAVRRAVTDVLTTYARNVDWLPAREAERVYGRSRSTLHRWRRAGLVISKKVAGTVYFARPVSADTVVGSPLTSTAADAARR
jgi:hypothetical protein